MIRTFQKIPIISTNTNGIVDFYHDVTHLQCVENIHQSITLCKFSELPTTKDRHHPFVRFCTYTTLYLCLERNTMKFNA